MAKVPSDAYLEKARVLSRDQAEQLLSRMRRRTMRRLEDKELTPLEAVALQLQKEDQDLEEWRQQWARIAERDEKKNAKAQTEKN